MMLIKESANFYILYNDEGFCLGNGSREALFRIFKKWGKKAGGNRVKLLRLMENFRVCTSFKKHTEYVRKVWKDSTYDVVEFLEELINSVTGIEYKKARKMPRVFAKKEVEEEVSAPAKIIRIKRKVKR